MPHVHFYTCVFHSFSLDLVSERHTVAFKLNCFSFSVQDQETWDLTIITVHFYIGHVHLAYNPSYSACFFSRNSIFLSRKISQQYFQPTYNSSRSLHHRLHGGTEISVAALMGPRDVAGRPVRRPHTWSRGGCSYALEFAMFVRVLVRTERGLIAAQYSWTGHGFEGSSSRPTYIGGCD
jgi:hypothetical protein